MKINVNPIFTLLIKKQDVSLGCIEVRFEDIISTAQAGERILMSLFDQILLVGTSIIALLSLRHLWIRVDGDIVWERSGNYHGVAISVLGVASLLLSYYGWGILGIMGEGTGNKLVAIVSSLIPFSWATGLVSKFYPKYEKYFLALMILGLFLITVSRFIDNPLMSRIVYPVFHSTAGMVVIATPVLAYKKGLVNLNFLLVALGGTLISAGGISMAFLSAGKQLLFFSLEFVLMILAPLFFLTILMYSWGLVMGERH